MRDLTARSTAFRTVFSNVVPVAIAWVLAVVLIRAGAATETSWLLFNGAELVAAITGLLLAWRLGATLAMYFLTAAAVHGLAMFTIYLAAGAVRGGPAQAAVMSAAFIGVAAGALTRGVGRSAGVLAG